MTCIAGVAHEGRVHLAGDSAGVSGWDLTVRADPKVFRNGEFVMGFTSSFRMGQLLAFSLSPPEPKEGQDIFRYMVTDFIAAVRDCLKAGGYAKSESGQESGGTFLVGYRGRLFRVEGDYQVGESADGYDAVGCGENLALGSLYATKGRPPDERLKLAMEAAERHSAGVRGPFTFVSTDPDRTDR